MTLLDHARHDYARHDTVWLCITMYDFLMTMTIYDYVNLIMTMFNYILYMTIHMHDHACRYKTMYGYV